MKTKKFVMFFSLVVLLSAGLYAVFTASTLPRTYEGKDDAINLYYNPHGYENSDSHGVADIIVKENLEKTMAVNNVAAVVFDFRGYDTLGESFILLTAIAGSYVVLSKSGKKAREDNK